jgi:hypothetical protein
MTPEEALRHAYSQDIARLPEDIQGMFDADAMAAAHASGQKHPMTGVLRHHMMVGHPKYVPQSADEFEQQDRMLGGYAGEVWTREQADALGRDPQSYEFSPGGKMTADAEARMRLHDDIQKAHTAKATSPTRGISSPGGFIPNFAQHQSTDEDVRTENMARAAQHYNDSIDRRKASVVGYSPETSHQHYDEQGRPHGDPTGYPSGMNHPLVTLAKEIVNPENAAGSLTTKMGGVLSDGASLFATALLRKAHGVDADPMAAAGDAAVRSQAADFNRTYPVVANDRGWRENNKLIEEGRGYRAKSEGMTAGDTWRGAIGNHILPESWNGQVPYLQPVINTALSFGNGMADGSGAVGSFKAIPQIVRGVASGVARSGVPGLARFAASTANDITQHLTKNPKYLQRFVGYNVDEAADVTNLAEGGIEATMPRDPRSNSQWSADQHTEEAHRQHAIKKLEGMNEQIIRPETNVTKAGKWLSGIIH